MRAEAREQAFVEFVTARQTHLRRIAYVLCGDWDQADDLLQGAFTRLYVAWSRVERDGTEEAFVRRFIVRADVGGHGSRRRSGHDDTEPPGLIDALQSLPTSELKVLVLHQWLGLTVEETAEDLGISAGAVRSRSARVTAALQDVLTGDRA
jgi:DNA-directed RNA polymerase specialized sigma24 family protein